MTTTYYAAMPFVNSEDGPVPGEGVQCQSASGARYKARRSDLVRDDVIGAVAFSRSSEAELGEFAAAEILLKVGIVPDDFILLTEAE